MKTCRTCNEELPLDSFAKRSGSKDGLQFTCKPCAKKYKKDYYISNSESIKSKVVARRKDLQARVAAHKAAIGCTDCGFNDPRALDFDHLRDKSFGINDMVKDGHSWESIMKEAEKCEVVCANCHRIRTAERLEA